MTIEWFRDLVIVIFGLGTTIAVLAFLVMGIIMFFKVRSIIDTAKRVSGDVEDISSCVKDEIVKPLAQAAAVVQGIRQAAGMFGAFGKKKKED